MKTRKSDENVKKLMKIKRLDNPTLTKEEAVLKMQLFFLSQNVKCLDDLEGASEPVRKGMSLLDKRRLQDKILHLFRKKKYQAIKEGEDVFMTDFKSRL